MKKAEFSRTGPSNGTPTKAKHFYRHGKIGFKTNKITKFVKARPIR